MAWRITVVGLQDLEKTIGDLAPRAARNIMRRVVTGVAREVRDDVRAMARSVVKKRTGRLFRSIKSRRNRSRNGIFEASVYIDLKKGSRSAAPHWHFIEFGTVKMAARPFIGPTVKRWQPKLASIYRQQFGLQLEKELAKRAKKVG